ncbi:MAG: hypothetical protein ACPIOQ_13150 [Promethearchaeia archaeon]
MACSAKVQASLTEDSDMDSTTKAFTGAGAGCGVAKMVLTPE